MKELIRDTAFGHLIRFVTSSKYMKFAEEADPTIWTRYIDEKKSGHLAHHGDTSPPEEGMSLEGLGGVRTRENEYSLFPPSHMWNLQRVQTYNSRISTARMNLASGVKVDPEKGRDIHLVSWYGDKDPENVRVNHNPSLSASDQTM
jgi:DHA1 family multidrug resistance protein-like MFS transporter